MAVMVNPAKTPFFTTEQRLSLLGKLFKNQPRVKIRSFSGAAVDLLAEEDTVFYVRGLRNTVDFEYENADHFASKKLKNDIVTLYIPAEQDDLHISSSLVKNSVKFKKDYSNLIPEEIKEEFEKIINGVK